MSWKQKSLKLRKITADELRVRARSALRSRLERWRYARSTSRPSAAACSTTELLERAAALLPGTRAENLARLHQQHPAYYSALQSQTLRRAQSILSGDWRSLGFRFDLSGEVDWHFDPRSDFRWPRSFYADVPIYELGDNVDVKYVWELGRQQYVCELARAWLLSGRGDFAHRARALILSWITKNPHYEGVHWTSALEVAVRSISWIWSLAALAQWSEWDQHDLRRIAQSLTEHADYLEHHLSFYSSPYNHLIGEATALLLVGCVLADDAAAARWRDLGRSVLLERGPQQFDGDGFTVEQATGYHYFTLGFLTLGLLAARSHTDSLSAIEDTLHRAYRAGAVLAGSDGRWPQIGDVDSARSIPVPTDDFWDFRPLCHLGAAIWSDSRLKFPAVDPGAELYWLLGTEGLARFEALSADHPSSGAAVLAHSGYAVAQNEAGDWLLFDAGPIAHGLHADATPSVAHGHADTLQVLYHCAERPLLLDPGTQSYAGPRQRIDYFRGPSAHNTIQIDGSAPVRTAGRLAWSHEKPRPTLDANLSNSAWLLRASTEWDNVRIQRHVLALPDLGLWIADWVQCDKPRHVRWFWQLPDVGCHSLEADPCIRWTSSDRQFLLAGWTTAGNLEVELAAASPDSPIAWHAPGYGQLRPASRLGFTVPDATRVLLCTYIGREFVPAEVTLDHETLVCKQTGALPGEIAGDSGTYLMRGRVDAAVMWKVQTPDSVLSILGGCDAPPPDADWQTLDGAGNWPAFVAARELALGSATL